MIVARAYLKGWTASYRFPPFAAVQPSLGTPPLSTIYGLLSAATGRLIAPQETAVGYVAPFKGKGIDLERTRQIGEGGRIEKIDILKRDFVFAPELHLYLANIDLAEHLRYPRYPLLLGRSSELAQLVEIKTVDLKPVHEAKFQFTILPFPWEGIASPILALPIAFNSEIPRRPILPSPFYILEAEPQIVRQDPKRGQIYLDPERGWGVYLHAFR